MQVRPGVAEGVHMSSQPSWCAAPRSPQRCLGPGVQGGALQEESCAPGLLPSLR